MQGSPTTRASHRTLRRWQWTQAAEARTEIERCVNKNTVLGTSCQGPQLHTRLALDHTVTSRRMAVVRCSCHHKSMGLLQARILNASSCNAENRILRASRGLWGISRHSESKLCDTKRKGKEVEIEGRYRRSARDVWG